MSSPTSEASFPLPPPTASTSHTASHPAPTLNASTPPLLSRRSDHLLRSASHSGSASPSYGSFPLSHSPSKESLERTLHDKLVARGSGRTRRWETSRERLLSRSDTSGRELFDSDADSDEEGLVEGRYGGGRSNATSVRGAGSDGEDSEDEEEDGSGSWGVMKMELMSRNWGKRGLCAIYAGVYLISSLLSLESNVTPTVEPYFLSLLGSHSLLSSVVIITSLAHAVGKPPMAKILDVFGRAEGVALAAVLYSLGYLLTASAKDVRVYAVARCLAALGAQGLQLVQQVIIADTSSLLNRGLITSTISLPWLATTWIGPVIGQWFQQRGEAGYRAVYATFGILLPFVASALFGTLVWEWRKVKQAARRLGLKSPSVVGLRRSGGSVASSRRNSGATYRSKGKGKGKGAEWLLLGRARMSERDNVGVWTKTKEVWNELDAIGLVSLTFGAGMFLLPFTLAAHRPEAWEDPGIWALIIGGALMLVFFGYYEVHYSSNPVIPPRLIHNRTIVAGAAFGFFHFVSTFTYASFFTSFLQVARDFSPRDASYISESYIFSACLSVFFAGYLIRVTHRYKWIGIIGVLIHFGGAWLMLRTRNLDAPTWEIVLSQAISGWGGGFTTVAAQIGCQSVVRHQDVAIATTVLLTVTQIGGAVGGAGAGAVWSNLLPRRLHLHLPPTSYPLIPEIMSSLPFALSFPKTSIIRQAIDESYVDTQRVLNIIALVTLVPALVAVCWMEDTDLEEADAKQAEELEGVVVLGRAQIVDEESTSETSSLLGSVGGGRSPSRGRSL